VRASSRLLGGGCCCCCCSCCCMHAWVSGSKLAGHGRIMVCTYMICDIPED
jgi:hypothetical protein